MVTARWFCDTCQQEYSTEAEARACEEQEPPPVPWPQLQSRDWVKLDARGLKRGNIYVQARFVRWQLAAAHVPGQHAWYMEVDRRLHLLESEPFDGNTCEPWYLLLDDPVRSSCEELNEIYKDELSQLWKDGSARFTERLPWMIHQWPLEGPWGLAWRGDVSDGVTVSMAKERYERYGGKHVPFAECVLSWYKVENLSPELRQLLDGGSNGA